MVAFSLPFIPLAMVIFFQVLDLYFKFDSQFLLPLKIFLLFQLDVLARRVVDRKLVPVLYLVSVVYKLMFFSSFGLQVSLLLLL